MQHPDYLELTSRQMGEWMAYDRLEPISIGTRVDVSAAMISHVLANVNRDPKERREPFLLSDFLVRWDPEDVETAKGDPTPEDLWAKAQAWAMLGVGEVGVLEEEAT